MKETKEWSDSQVSSLNNKKDDDGSGRNGRANGVNILIFLEPDVQALMAIW